MDFLDPAKKRKHNLQLYVGYGLMAVLILTASVLLLLFTFGFSFDRNTGTVIQNGLLFIDTNPVAADVFVNGERKGRGDQRLVLASGAYDIEIREEGYRTWRHDINLGGGQLVRFAYPFLFAEDITTSTYRTFEAAPRLMTTSPDRRWMLVQEAEQIDAFVLYDLNQRVNLPTFFTLPPGLMRVGAASSRLELVEWSNNNRHVLLRHRLDGATDEFILLDRENPNQSQNLTTRYSDLTVSDISLVDKRFDRYHLFDRSSGILFRAELAADQIEPIVEGVITYRSHGGDTLLYVTAAPVVDEGEVPSDSGTNQQVALRLISGDEDYDLLRLPAGADANYYIDIARFAGAWYVVAASSVNNQVLVFEDPLATVRRSREEVAVLSPIAVLRADAAIRQLNFSANARNIMAQAGNQFLVYDIERDASYDYEFADDSALATWMDGHRIVSTAGNRLRVIDFDGRNEHDLTACRARFSVLFDRDYQYAYCVAPTEADTYGTLTRVLLRSPDDES